MTVAVLYGATIVGAASLDPYTNPFYADPYAEPLVDFGFVLLIMAAFTSICCLFASLTLKRAYLK